MCGWAGIGRFRTTLRASFGEPESNCRHHDFQSCALPTELPRHGPDSMRGDCGLGVRGGAWVVKPLDAMGCWHRGTPDDA